MPTKNRKPSRARTPAQTHADLRRNWAQRIRATWAKAVRAIVETGKQLLEAKDDLSYGDFTQMIYNELPFSGSTADRLMKIAKHKVLSQSDHARNLPAHWTTLYELSRLPAKKVLALIEDGTISPKMERGEAATLVMRELLVQVKDARSVRVEIVHSRTVLRPRGYVVHATPPDPTLDDSIPSEPFFHRRGSL
jgi:hypothetical protein